MPKKGSKLRGYTTFSIPTGLMHKVEDIVKSGTYKNKTDFILEAIRKRLRELGALESEGASFPVLEHFNLTEHGVIVLDRELDPPNGRLIDVYFKPDANNRVMTYCEYDESTDCKHVNFALELPKTQEIFREKGWKPKQKS